MATEVSRKLEWTFMSKASPSNDLLEMLVPGEQILHCYKTVRDLAAITNKRIIIRDAQGITGKKVEVYCIPFRSIDMWSTENAGKILDFNSELELWTKAGHMKLKVNKDCNIREFDEILSKSILD